MLSGTSLDPSELRYVFKMVKQLQPAGNAQVNGQSSDEYAGQGESYVKSFDMSDVADFNVNNVVLDKTQAKGQNGAAGFRTDTDISGNLATRERNLQKFEFSGPDTSLELGSGGLGGWDQFATNDRITGKKSNYDETMYTTAIDRSNPEYAKRAARADRIAREIESSAATNSHVREEREANNPLDDQGLDEEDKYANRYQDGRSQANLSSGTVVSAESSRPSRVARRTNTRPLRDALPVPTPQSRARQLIPPSCPLPLHDPIPQPRKQRSRPLLLPPRSPPPLHLHLRQHLQQSLPHPKHPRKLLSRPRQSLLLQLRPLWSRHRSPALQPSRQLQLFLLARLQSRTTPRPTSSTTCLTHSRLSRQQKNCACQNDKEALRVRTKR